LTAPGFFIDYQNLPVEQLPLESILLLPKEANNLPLSYLSKIWNFSKKFKPALLKMAYYEPLA